MTEQELKKDLMMYEIFLRVDEEEKEEPEMDEDGYFITNSWEWDGDTWFWEKDEDGGWHRTGFKQDEFDRFVAMCVAYREERLRKEYHLEKPK